MAQRWDNDPEYKRNRAVLLAMRLPCARCGGAIDYDGPRFAWVNGRRVENLAAFDCGHVVDRALGGDNSLANLQAEHARCGRHAGARLGNARRRRGPTPPALAPATSRAW